MEQQSLPHPENILVMKYGGTSVGTAKAMRSAIRIICDTKQEHENLVVVTSAISGATNSLIQSAVDAANGKLNTAEKTARELTFRHHELIDQLVSDPNNWLQLKMEINHLITNFTNLCQAIKVIGELSPRALDAVASLGERLSVRVLAAGVESAGCKAKAVEASQLIITDDHFQGAVPDMKETTRHCQKQLYPLMHEGIIPIVTGFMGATKDGSITTLGRGGSDYSASILGVALNAKDVWIWTDVTGVMSADPRIIPEAKTISILSFREVSEMAFYGAKVLHPKSVQPVVEAGITLRICNTFHPKEMGTILVDNDHAIDPGKIKAVTSSNGFKLVSVSGVGWEGAMDISARIFSGLLAAKLSIPMVVESSSEQSLCFPVAQKDTDRVVELLNSVLAKEIERQDVQEIIVSDTVDIITVICPRLRSNPSVITSVLSSIDKKGFIIKALSFGASDVSLNIIVSADDTKVAMKTIHDLI